MEENCPKGKWSAEKQLYLLTMETNLERDLSLIMKCMTIKFDGEKMSGEEAFKKLVIHDMLGKGYVIDWDKGEITTQ